MLAGSFAAGDLICLDMTAWTLLNTELNNFQQSNSPWPLWRELSFWLCMYSFYQPTVACKSLLLAFYDTWGEGLWTYIELAKLKRKMSIMKLNLCFGSNRLLQLPTLTNNFFMLHLYYI